MKTDSRAEAGESSRNDLRNSTHRDRVRSISRHTRSGAESNPQSQRLNGNSRGRSPARRESEDYERPNQGKARGRSPSAANEPRDRRDSKRRRPSQRRSPSPDRSHHHHQKRRRRSPSRDRRRNYSVDDDYDDDDQVIETEEERRRRWDEHWERTRHYQPPRPYFTPLHQLRRRRKVLEIDYWERTPDNADRKQAHMDQLDRISGMSREDWILNTTLMDVHVAIEPNLFPYETPSGVTHHTLWSRTYLTDDEVESYVEEWLDRHRPSVRAWAWDPSNLSEGMSVDLYHVHVFFWEPPKTRAVLKSSRSRSHRAYLPPPASPSPPRPLPPSSPRQQRRRPDSNRNRPKGDQQQQSR